MSNIVSFNFEGSAVRAIEIGGDPWFVGKDVAGRLGYADTANAMKQHCKGVVKRHPLQTAGGMQEIRILSEPDVFRLIVGSKLPSAERFERWLFEEVLPAIRKTGGYMVSAPKETPAPPPIDPANMIHIQLLERAMRGEEKRLQFEHEVTTVLCPDGSKKVTEHLRITPLGLTKPAEPMPERRPEPPADRATAGEAAPGRDPRSVFVSRVRRRVKALGETPTAIAVKHGLSGSYIRDILAKNPRKRGVRYTGLFRLAAALDCDVEYLTLQQDTPRRQNGNAWQRQSPQGSSQAGRPKGGWRQ